MGASAIQRTCVRCPVGDDLRPSVGSALPTCRVWRRNRLGGVKRDLPSDYFLVSHESRICRTVRAQRKFRANQGLQSAYREFFGPDPAIELPAAASNSPGMSRGLWKCVSTAYDTPSDPRSSGLRCPIAHFENQYNIGNLGCLARRPPFGLQLAFSHA